MLAGRSVVRQSSFKDVLTDPELLDFLPKPGHIFILCLHHAAPLKRSFRVGRLLIHPSPQHILLQSEITRQTTSNSAVAIPAYQYPDIRLAFHRNAD